MKMMKSKSMMISVQCQTQFSNDILAKYSWSFSQGNHVRLQHKEDIVHAKQASIAMPKVTIQHIVQPLHIKLAMQHLSFSQLAVYKQQLLRETSATTIKGDEAKQASTLLPKKIEQTKQIIIDERQSNPAWVQMKQVAQHFKQDRFIQSIIDKRSTDVHYHMHAQHINQVVAQNQALEAKVASLSTSPSIEHNAVQLSGLMKQSLMLEHAEAKAVQAKALQAKTSQVNVPQVVQKHAEAKASQVVQKQEAMTHSESIITSQAKQPARMVWHRRVEERQQQWQIEQKKILNNETELQHADNELIHTKVIQRLERHDLRSYLNSQHINLTTNQLIQLKRIRAKDVTQRVLKRIEQRLTKENITLHYAEHTVKRKRGRPKKENHQLDQERQAVTQHIDRNRKMAAVLKTIEVQGSTKVPSTSATMTMKQAASAQVMVKPSANITQLSNIQHLTERRIISVSEQWLTRIKSKEQLTSLSLIHLTKQDSKVSSKHFNDDAAKQRHSSDSIQHRNRAEQQSSNAKQQSSSAMQQNNGATQQSNGVIQHHSSNTSSQQSGGAAQQSIAATQQQSSNASQQSSGAVHQQSNGAAQQGNATDRAAVSTQSTHPISTHQSEAGYALSTPATDRLSNGMGLQEQSQPEEISFAEAHTLRIINRQLQAKVEHVHIQSKRWQQTAITKHIQAVLGPELQSAQSASTKDVSKPLLQAKWQNKLAVSQSVLLNKIQEQVHKRMNESTHRIETQETIHVHEQTQQAVIIHTQSKQMLTLKSGRSISLSAQSMHLSAKLQKLTTNDRHRDSLKRVLAKQAFIYKDKQEHAILPITARKLVHKTTALHGIDKQIERIGLPSQQTALGVQQSNVTGQLRSSSQQLNYAEQQHRVIVPLASQPIGLLHKANHFLPAGKNAVKQTALKPKMTSNQGPTAQAAVVRRQGLAPTQSAVVSNNGTIVKKSALLDQQGPAPTQSAVMHQQGPTVRQQAMVVSNNGTIAKQSAIVHQQALTATQTAVMHQLNQATTQAEVVRQQDLTVKQQAVVVRQRGPAAMQPVLQRQLVRSKMMPTVLQQPVEGSSGNSMLEINARLSHAASAKTLKVDPVVKDGYPEEHIAQPLSLKRVEMDTVKKQVALLVKAEQKVQQKQQAEPIAMMQTHIKKLEEQLQQQQQLLLETKSPLAIKQLSNQIYDELQRKIKFERQRLGR